MVRESVDAAPGADGVPRVCVNPVEHLLLGIFVDLELLLLMLEDEHEARGPPVGSLR